MMKAVRIRQPGGPEVLETVQVPVPAPGPGEVLVRVRAAGVNRPDILQRQGKYPPPPGVTEIPGLEIAGDVVESRSALWKPEDNVCALIAGGGYAEYAVAPAAQCLPVPTDMTMAQAASLPEAVFTVWNNLFVRGRLKTGETVLIHGGASGIGTMAIQMAAALGAKIIVTAGNDDKCAACRNLGAHLAVNYKTQDFDSQALKFTGGRGVDVVLDMVGGDYIGRNLNALAPEGRHVSIAFLQGAKAEIDIRVIMQKRLTLTGSTLRARPAEEKSALANGIREIIWPLVESGKIKAVVYKTFDLSDAAAAHAALEKGDHIGKIVLTVKA